MNYEAAVIEAKQGNEEAFNQILKAFTPKINGIVRKRIFHIPGMDKEDIIQLAYIKLYEAVQGYDPSKVDNSQFEGFAYMVIIRGLKNSLKKSSNQKSRMLNTAISYNVPIPNDKEKGTFEDFFSSDVLIKQPEDLLGEKEIYKFAKTLLSKTEKQVFELHQKGFNYKEIAEMLGKTPKQIDNACQRIKHKLRENRDKYEEVFCIY